MTRLTFSRRAALSTPVLSTQTVGRTSIRCRASAPRAHRPPHLARNFVMSGDEALIAKTQQLALHDQPPERFARRRDELRAHRCIDVSGRLRLVSLECLQRTGELAPRGAERSRRLLHELHVERFGESDRHVNFSESPAPLLVVRMPPARVPCAHTLPRTLIYERERFVRRVIESTLGTLRVCPSRSRSTVRRRSPAAAARQSGISLKNSAAKSRKLGADHTNSRVHVEHHSILLARSDRRHRALELPRDPSRRRHEEDSLP